MTTTAHTTAPSTAPTRLLGYRDRLTYTGTLHLLADLVLGTTYFTVLATLFALSAGLAITVVGIPLLALTLLLARGIGHLERARIRLLLGTLVPAPRHDSSPFWRRLTDRADWRACGYGVLLFPIGLIAGGLTLLGWTSAAAALSFPFYAPALRDPALHLGTLQVGGVAADLGSVAVGVALLAVMPQVVRALTGADRRLARALLGSGA